MRTGIFIAVACENTHERTRNPQLLCTTQHDNLYYYYAMGYDFRLNITLSFLSSSFLLSSLHYLSPSLSQSVSYTKHHNHTITQWDITLPVLYTSFISLHHLFPLVSPLFISICQSVPLLVSLFVHAGDREGVKFSLSVCVPLERVKGR